MGTAPPRLERSIGFKTDPRRALNEVQDFGVERERMEGGVFEGGAVSESIAAYANARLRRCKPAKLLRGLADKFDRATASQSR